MDGGEPSAGGGDGHTRAGRRRRGAQVTLELLWGGLGGRR